MTIRAEMLQVLAFELILKELPEEERKIVQAMEDKIKEIISTSPYEGMIAIGHIGVLLSSENPDYIRQVLGDRFAE